VVKKQWFKTLTGTSQVGQLRHYCPMFPVVLLCGEKLGEEALSCKLQDDKS